MASDNSGGLGCLGLLALLAIGVYYLWPSSLLNHIWYSGAYSVGYGDVHYVRPARRKRLPL
jgi:hypothetical protein